MIQRCPAAVFGLALALAVTAGCEGEWPETSVVGVGGSAPIRAEYRAAWTYTVQVPALRRYETGTCYGDFDVDRRSRSGFSGRFTIPEGRTCIPTESGTFEGDMQQDGDFRIRLSLPSGGHGVFEEYPNCFRVWADPALSGTVWDEHLQGRAEALYNCNMLGVGWTDIHLHVRLNATPVP